MTEAIREAAAGQQLTVFIPQNCFALVTASVVAAIEEPDGSNRAPGPE